LTNGWALVENDIDLKEADEHNRVSTELEERQFVRYLFVRKWFLAKNVFQEFSANIVDLFDIYAPSYGVWVVFSSSMCETLSALGEIGSSGCALLCDPAALETRSIESMVAVER
tara:strand:- start:1191 stop:1532 length:342 start_codon:yes stop_codon:yes gene_type:complete